MKYKKPLTRLGGDGMLVGIKDAAKLIGISIIACCAVLVCTMFMNFNIDIVQIKDKIASSQMQIFYDAQVSMAKIICIISGGCLLITAVIMLIFYVKHYIDIHKKELGILKALGYSNIKIAKNFWVFGFSILIGTAVGFAGAFLIMPTFYKVMNEDKILPDIAIHFHFELLIYMIIIPTIFFAVLAVMYAYNKLKNPVMSLLKDNLQSFSKVKKIKPEKNMERTFIEDLKKSTLKSKKTLVLFIVFASFCFSTMTQMSFSMDELSSVMMGVMILLIGLVLASTTLFIAITTVINGNKKTISMMRVFGYSQKECSSALLGGYRPMAYIGFAVGTVYQYALLRIVMELVFKDLEDAPVYKFDLSAFLITLGIFIVIYELIMYTYSEKIKKITIKEIMSE